MIWKRTVLIIAFILIPIFVIIEEVLRAWQNLRMKETMKDNFKYWREIWSRN